MTTVILSTSDRLLFKRCRRKWDWQSTQRQNLIPVAEAASSPLWYGSGFHFALEDFHGHKRYPSAFDAFTAYSKAFRPHELPADSEDLMVLAEGMLAHYTMSWLRRRDEYQTLWVDGEPQVEVSVDLDITNLVVQRAWQRDMAWVTDPLDDADGKIVYRVTFDRVCVDSEGRLYIMDYKTAAKFDSAKLETDSQVTAYTWAGRYFYGDRYEVEGIIWMTFKKAFPDVPKELVRGGFSENRQASVSYDTFAGALLTKYGAIPTSYVPYMNHLAMQEGADGDKFIKRDIMRRNVAFTQNEEWKIADEVLDMLNPQLSLYPNPTRDCSWDCSFRVPCLMKDDGSEWEEYMAGEYVSWVGYNDSWRQRIVYPETVARSSP